MKLQGLKGGGVGVQDFTVDGRRFKVLGSGSPAERSSVETPDLDGPWRPIGVTQRPPAASRWLRRW